MYAIVTDGAITQIGSSVQRMFPNTSFSGTPDSAFKTANGVMDVVNAEQKDGAYYYVSQGDITLVAGVPTQGFTNTAMAIEDVNEVDVDGNPIYVQEWDADFDNGAGELAGKMVDTSVQLVTRGLKLETLVHQLILMEMFTSTWLSRKPPSNTQMQDNGELICTQQ